jgi:hypothetical protein
MPPTPNIAAPLTWTLGVRASARTSLVAAMTAAGIAPGGALAAAGTEIGNIDAPTQLRAWVGLGSVGSAGAAEVASIGGGGFGSLGVALGGHPERSLGVEAHVRELVLSAEPMSVGVVTVDLRYPAGTGLYALAGFAHHHEQRWDAMLSDVIGTAAATDERIQHRSGVELGAGWESRPWTRGTANFGNRFRTTAQLSAVILPATPGPSAYAMLEIGIRAGLTRPLPRARATR